MKRLLLTLMALFTGTHLFAQKIEVSAQAYSGLFHFGGRSATASSTVVQSSITGNPDNYTNNPYGNKNAISYGIAAQVQAVSKNGFIFGLQAGYEFLQSKVNIGQYASAVYYDPNVNYIAPAHPDFTVTGHANLENRFINLNPYIGYRLQLQKVNLDILPGIDVGFNLSTYDTGTVKDNDDRVYTIDRKINNTPTDVRLRFGLAATYNQFGITVSYAHGLTNYESNVVSDTKFEAHSELIRFGISCQLL